MDPASLLTYMTTLVALTLAPGPLVAVLAARSASKDRPGACALAVGICAGDTLVILAICAGLGLWLQSHPEVFIVGKYISVGFLLWMAVRMWAVPTVAENYPAQTGGILASVLLGFAICLSSPQTVVMYLVLLPRVADLSLIGISGMVVLIVATTVTLLGAFLMVILFASRMQQLLRSSAGVTAWARGMSLTIAVSAVGIFLW